MNLEIKSNELKKDLELKLYKNYDKFRRVDLNKITDISLKKVNFLGESTDYCSDDLVLFPNLFSCSLFKFEIKENDIKNLNQQQKLNYIFFDFCKFNIDKLYFKENISTICFNMCENLKLDMLENTLITNLKIIGNKRNKINIDITLLKNATNLEKIEIHNYKINNLLKILDIAPNLKEINISGSYIDDIYEIHKLREKINVLNDREFTYVESEENIIERRLI